MMKPLGYASFVTLLMMSSSLPQVWAGQTEVHESDIAEASVSSVAITTTPGHLSIARNRNCLMTNPQGIAVLETCPVDSQGKPTVSTFTMIELKAGHCLADEANGLTLKACDVADDSQQWETLPGVSTEVKSIKSKLCLTSAGLDKPVKLEKCSGVPAQIWTLPADSIR